MSFWASSAVQAGIRSGGKIGKGNEDIFPLLYCREVKGRKMQHPVASMEVKALWS